MAEYRQILRAMVFADTALVFIKGNIQRPVQFILDAPMRSDRALGRAGLP